MSSRWQCPACRTAIRLLATEDRSKAGVIYRCALCRLELLVDPEADEMTMAPL